MSCGELFLKSGSSTFTGYFLIVSTAFILYGVCSTNYLLNVNRLETIEDELVALPSACLVVFGLLLLLFVILGCCSICREIPCCLESYSIFLAVLSAAQIGLGVFCLIKFDSQNHKLEHRIFNDVTMIYIEKPNEMDITQKWLNCCGVGGPNDYLANNRTIPLSCCEGEDILENCTITTPSTYSEGCFLTVFHYILNTNYIIGWSLIIVGITEILAAIMGIGLSCAFWRRSRITWL